MNSYNIDTNWYTDTGTTDHITGELEKLVVRDKYNGVDQVHTANGSGMHISHIGQSTIHTPTRDLHLKDILHVPSTKKNLVFVHRLASDNNVFFEFHHNFFLIKDRDTRSTLLKGPCRTGLYPFPSSSTSKQAFGVNKVSVARWHSRLGHPSFPIVEKVLKSHDLPYLLDSNKHSVCDACQQAKSHQLPYPIFTSVSTQPLELVFSDVWGPTPESVGRYKYYVSFIDGFSKFTWIYLLKYKSEFFQKFHEFQKLVERLFDKKIIVVQFDWGGEYEKLNSFFTKVGITHLVSCPHVHQQNGVAERKRRHIVEVGLSLLAHAHMPHKFWDEAFLTATYLINRTPSKIISFETPLKRLFHTKPEYSSLRTFGCACWPNLRPYNNHKLAFRSKECAFLGYSNLHKGFKCLDISTGRVYISRDVVFDEDVLPFSRLHPNVGARLQFETLLLPSNLLNPSDGDELIDDSVSNDANPTNFGARNHNLQAQQEEIGAGATIGADLVQTLRASPSGSAPIIGAGEPGAAAAPSPSSGAAACPDNALPPTAPGASIPPRQPELATSPVSAHPGETASAVAPTPATGAMPGESASGPEAGSSVPGAPGGISTPANQRPHTRL
jgi:hypothetical protein